MKKNMRCHVCGRRRKKAHDVNFKIINNLGLDSNGRCVKIYYVCNDIWLNRG